MGNITGQVSAIKELKKPWGPEFHLTVNGQDYKVGKYAPRGINNGDFVEFAYTTKVNGQYQNHSITTGTLRKAEGDKAPPVAAKTPAPTARTNSFVPNDERQTIISKQAALNTSIAYCNLAVAAGAFGFPAKTAAADKLGLFESWVNEQAARFYNLSTGQTWRELSSGTAVKQEAGQEEEFEDSPWPED